MFLTNIPSISIINSPPHEPKGRNSTTKPVTMQNPRIKPTDKNVMHLQLPVGTSLVFWSSSSFTFTSSGSRAISGRQLLVLLGRAANHCDSCRTREVYANMYVYRCMIWCNIFTVYIHIVCVYIIHLII